MKKVKGLFLILVVAALTAPATATTTECRQVLRFLVSP